MLNDRIAAGYEQAVSGVFAAPGVSMIAHATGSESAPQVVLLETDAESVATDPEQLLVECFGPAALIVRYSDPDDLSAALKHFEGSLTGTVHALVEDDPFVRAVLAAFEERVGRLIWREWPTGVAVATAQHHGGPYPATTNSLHTSVRTASIERFRRPIAYQNMPDRFLPPELRRNRQG